MKVTRIGQDLAVCIPADVAAELGLEEGAEVSVTRVTQRPELSETDLKGIMDGIRALAKPLPPGYRFDRDEANAR